MDGYMFQRCMLLSADLRYWLDLYSVWLSHSSLGFWLNDDLVFPPSTPQLGDHWSHPLHSKLKNALAQPQRTIMQMLEILKMIIIFKKRVSFCLICHNQTDRRHTNKQNNIFNMSDLKWKIVLFSIPIGAFRFLAFEKFHLKFAFSSTVIADTIFIISGQCREFLGTGWPLWRV